MGQLVKAQLIEIMPTEQTDTKDQPSWKVKDGGQRVEVQFNPESLKVTYANQLVQPQGGDQASGNAGRQFVGAGTTKLALQLWFDVNAMEKDPVDDVRRLTQKVVYFMTPRESGDPKKYVPPGVRFLWGSFLFDGIVEGMEETIEFFSPEGKPLRASITLTLSQQKILVEFNKESKPGHKTLNSAKDGDSLQSMAAKNGKGDWQSIAAANGIEDPLRLTPGRLVDLNVGASIGQGASLDAATGVGTSVPVSVPGANLNASLGGGLGGSFGVN